MLHDLIHRFAAVIDLPVEVDEVVECITDMGVQDEIYLFPADMDIELIRGAHRRFTYHKTPYGDPQFVTHAVYPENVDVEKQRVIAVKELVHIFDDTLASTGTDDEVCQLLDKLTGPHSGDDFDLAHFQATKDGLAFFHALQLLLPEAALENASKATKNGTMAHDDIAKRACLPVGCITLMLSDRWDELKELANDL